MIYLTNKNRFDLALGARRIEAIQRGVVNYFVSRDEDNQRMIMMARMGRYGNAPLAVPPQPRPAYPYPLIRRPPPFAAPQRYYHGRFY